MSNSKKTETTITPETEPVTPIALTEELALEIKALAEAFGLSYQYLLTQSKRPMDGQPFYSSVKVYWDRVQEVLLSKLVPEGEETTEEHILAYNMIVESLVIEKQAKSKKTQNVYTVGTFWTVAKLTVKVIAITSSQICLQDVDKNGKELENLRAWRLSTLNNAKPVLFKPEPLKEATQVEAK